MPTISLDERKKVNHKLKSLGFGGIDDPNIFAQIALLYKTHDAFRGLLMSTAPDQRRIAYESLKPHLCFKPKPLADYEMETKERAEREQWDVYDGSAYPKPFQKAEITLNDVAEKAIIEDLEQDAKGFLTLNCRRCTYVKRVPGDTRVDASIRAKKAGWDLINSVCPTCMATIQ